MTRAAVAAAALLLAVGCGEPDAPKATKPAVPVADPTATMDIHQILLAYAPVKPRSREAAWIAATRLIERAQAGERFESLILEATDDLNDEGKPFNDGSYTIALRGGLADPVMVKYVRTLKVGEVGPVPYDSGKALVVVRRDR